MTLVFRSNDCDYLKRQKPNYQPTILRSKSSRRPKRFQPLELFNARLTQITIGYHRTIRILREFGKCQLSQTAPASTDEPIRPQLLTSIKTTPDLTLGADYRDQGEIEARKLIGNCASVSNRELIEQDKILSYI